MKLSSFALASLSLAIAQALPLAAPEQQVLNIASFEGADLPEVDTAALQALITEEALRERAETLYEIATKSEKKFGHPTRVIGSKGHWSTIDYIKKEIHKLHGYYNVSVQALPATVSETNAFDTLINGTKPESLTDFSLSPPTPNKDFVTGPLVVVANNGCDLSDFPEDTSGSVVLIKRGVCTFTQKSVNAGKLGALASIIYNNEDGEVRGSLGGAPPDAVVAPTVGISKKDGEKYVSLLSQGPLSASVLVDSYIATIKTLNVIAETVDGDGDNIVMLGAHSDSVTAGPGINDDGSGTISLLEVAKQLTKFKVNNKVRFAWWAAEEEGLIGSNYYAEHLSPEENQKIRLFMDYDMMASPNYEYEVYNASNALNPVGSEELKNLYIDYYESKGLDYVLIPFDGRSDYVGFIENGIPGGGIAAGAEKKNAFNGEVLDRCYHSLCDDVSNLAFDAFLINTQLIAHSVATYAKSLADFPVRQKSASVMAETANNFKYRGGQLVI
ncbi:hypothetical protein OGAPHI_006925 [Ogataea philodendri]|uniref:Peptide hydrolase n=1 Tax=Ogataea philodendri TaxID=1378263 RepID=A0A9P8NVR9_9ASCO|nr:uncharacterized protein OGAPHI_006925 [Ogataea philodendri]KAH3660339.1 hypothetical protein OGAPHI_006925 [Ogataea philodendri]